MVLEIRDPSHAGSWYKSSREDLSADLDRWLQAVPNPLTPIGKASAAAGSVSLPVPGARVIIAPHAGYDYSGPAAAWAYRAWDVKDTKRVFLLGPSHKFYLTNAALSRCDRYATPLGDLVVDKTTTENLHATGEFRYMTQSVDEDEHSLEMHLPYIYKVLSTTRVSDEHELPLLVPIMVGSTSPETEQKLGKVLAPYLRDPANAFVVSSDFAHWGQRFDCTYYLPALPSSASGEQARPVRLDRSNAARLLERGCAIHESIRHVDFQCIDACESGSHAAWTAILEKTNNLVCGRHPIAVVLAAIEELDRLDDNEPDDKKRKFSFVRYERSSECKKLADSSVSYASAFAVI